MLRPLLLTAAALLALPAAAQNRLALTCIENRTPTMDRINFEYRYGDGEWQATSVDRGYWRAIKHWYDFPNENSGPRLYVRFDVDATSGTYYQTFELQQYAVPNDQCSSQGKKYRFTLSGNRIQLVRTN